MSVAPSGDDQVKRVLAAKALQSRADAHRFSKKLGEKAFWRFRRRRQINRAIVRAKEDEQAALRALRSTDD